MSAPTPAPGFDPATMILTALVGQADRIRRGAPPLTERQLEAQGAAIASVLSADESEAVVIAYNIWCSCSLPGESEDGGALSLPALHIHVPEQPGPDVHVHPVLQPKSPPRRTTAKRNPDGTVTVDSEEK